MIKVVPCQLNIDRAARHFKIVTSLDDFCYLPYKLLRCGSSLLPPERHEKYQKANSY
jgi:hypothetical protein